MKFDSVDAILDFAITKEEDAAQFYTDLAGKMKRQHMKDIFEQFALEEKSHKAKLENVKKGKLLLSAQQKIMDLKVVDNLEEVIDPPVMESIKREKIDLDQIMVRVFI